MNVIIWDSTPARCTANQAAIASAATALGITIEIQVWTGPRAPQNRTLTPQCDLLLLHGTDENVAMTWFQSHAVVVPRILKYGGGGIDGGVPRPVSDTDPLNEVEGVGILKAARDTSTQGAFLDCALATWSVFPMNLLALRLLCEAWKMTNGPHPPKDAGIAVHAPSDLQEWLAPFDVNGDAAKAAALMGDAKDAAAAVFGAIGKSEELRAAIEALLSMTQGSSTRATN